MDPLRTSAGPLPNDPRRIACNHGVWLDVSNYNSSRTNHRTGSNANSRHQGSTDSYHAVVSHLDTTTKVSPRSHVNPVTQHTLVIYGGTGVDDAPATKTHLYADRGVSEQLRASTNAGIARLKCSGMPRGQGREPFGSQPILDLEPGLTSLAADGNQEANSGSVGLSFPCLETFFSDKTRYVVERGFYGGVIVEYCDEIVARGRHTLPQDFGMTGGSP